MTLNIPDEARDKGAESMYATFHAQQPTPYDFVPWGGDTVVTRFWLEIAKDGLAAALPLAVAAYLETLADEYELNAREADDRVRDHINVDNRTGAAIATVTSEINDAVADHLRECALELRGGTHD